MSAPISSSAWTAVGFLSPPAGPFWGAYARGQKDPAAFGALWRCPQTPLELPCVALLLNEMMTVAHLFTFHALFSR